MKLLVFLELSKISPQSAAPCIHNCVYNCSDSSNNKGINSLNIPIQMKMTTNLPIKLENLEHLPNSLPLDGAIRIELVEGVPIFRASQIVIERIAGLLAKQKDSSLTLEEENELDKYEELDDYLSLVNRMIRNISLNASQNTSPG